MFSTWWNEYNHADYSEGDQPFNSYGNYWLVLTKVTTP